ncbi:MAG: diaminopimelate epimerase [Planctomycetes bacterium]|nr:diaminopimelate epimerase [Planctomycetota bacterium]
MKFTKLHGLGNDYIYVDTTREKIDDPAAVARAVSDRHTGIGADGLILIGRSEHADVRMEMYNADGSRGEMCGNGIRCVGKYVVDRGIVTGPNLTVETDGGVRRLHCESMDGAVRSVRVDMGSPSLDPRRIPTTLPGDRVVDAPIEIGGRSYVVTCVSMGNPHAVVFTDSLDAIDLSALGPLFEHAPEFPERINTHFVRIDAPDHVTMKTWERGSGATRACGTGACAVCVAGAVTERTRRTIIASLPGGDLRLDWREDDHVYMTGPAEEVFSGVWNPR